MSVGNLKDYGNKGNNTPYQIGMLQELKRIEDAIVTGAGSSTQLRITTYQAIAGGVGYSISDIISRTDIILVATSTIISTLWFNETTGLPIAAPPIGDLVPYVPATVTVSNAFNLEATQLNVDASLTSIMNNPLNPLAPVRGYFKNITDNTAHDLLAAGGAGVKNYITQILVTNEHATVGTLVDIIEETSGDILYTGYAAPIGGGFSISFPTTLVQLTSNKKVQAICATTGANVTVSISGYKI